MATPSHGCHGAMTLRHLRLILIKGLTMKHHDRFPRTLDEAFKTPRYAQAIEGPERTGYPWLWWICMAIITGALLWLL